MARKPKRKVKRYYGKTEKEWRDWGEMFGKFMEQRGKEFGEDIGDLGRRLENKFELRSKELEKDMHDWWFKTFGFIGPLMGSIIGIVFISFGVLALNIINVPLGSSFISAVSNFLFRNLSWFFAFFLFFGYTDYFSKRFPRTYWIASPIAASIGIIITIWIAIWLLNLINVYSHSTLISFLSNFLFTNLGAIFVVTLVLGYVIIFIKAIIKYSLRV